ncbi:MAG TPA: hypothetical protein VL096_15790 [Pirellulaceae bacterium]|nr:hypothetical protein [Pirellulaceae bacterium]
MSWRLSRYKAGDLVEVRSAAEILATLDAQGRCNGLPFMPEMLAFCGQRLRVRAVAHKTCETARKTWQGRRLETTVHLADTRCNGAAHGGCQADCTLFWHDAWLKPIDSATPQSTPSPSQTTLTEPQLHALAKLPTSTDEKPRYTCQTTQLFDATTLLPWWDVRQYWRDVRTGNHSPRHVLGVLWLAFLEKCQAHTPLGYRLIKIFREGAHRWLTGRELPNIQGAIPRGARTPGSTAPALQPGDYVRVKSEAEIIQTVDEANNNRGLSFEAEMAVYCGKIFRVRSCVTEILDEQSGEMVKMKQPCIILDGAYCSALYSQCRLLCPRAVTPYWREIWLEKIETPAPSSQTVDNATPQSAPATTSA